MQCYCKWYSDLQMMMTGALLVVLRGEVEMDIYLTHDIYVCMYV